ncbi:MAG: MFS transporter [Bryobacterales bacterium]|nr:MFS transporter [Bryobacterales bacterium]
MSAPTTALKPTRTRHWVVVYAVTLAIITYIDRVCISQAAPLIRRDLGLSAVEMGMAFSAFGIAYALFEIPGGWLGDWLGPRRVLMRIVIWWSFFTAATGWVWNTASLVVTRFLFGAGEAGCFPNLTKVFTTWLPQHERVRAQGIMWMSARWGGAFTPMLVVWVLQHMSWRRSFELFGAIGVVWAIFFYRWFRDNPRDHPGVNQAELALLQGAERAAAGHGNVPWGTLIRSRTVWMLWAQYFCVSYPWYFYITWLPTYLQEYRGLTPEHAARLAVFPLFFGGLGCMFGGFIAPYVTRWTGSVARARRLIAYTGAISACGFLLLHSLVRDPFWAMLAMGMASFSNDILMPGSWGACMDVGGKYAGTLSGSMNMMGNFGGALAPVVLGYVLEKTGSWLLNFYIMAGIYLLAALAWRFIDPVTPLKGAGLDE